MAASQENSVHKIVHGVVGITKALTGTGGANAELIQQRAMLCKACEHADTVVGVIDQCIVCGCSIWAKIRNADEHCPLAKW